jgi:hypothetical protein
MAVLSSTLVDRLIKSQSELDEMCPVSSKRLKSIIVNLINYYNLKCTHEPKVHCTKLNKNDRVENTSTIVEMFLVHVDKNGHESSPTNVNIYFDSFLKEDKKYEYTITVILKNKFKETIYRPYEIGTEMDVMFYVNNVFNELSNKL